MVKRLLAVATMVALLVSLTGLGSAVAYHEDDVTVHEFAHPLFEGRWARTDDPVANLMVDRTWIWGPSPYTPGMMEPYTESPGGMRLVQYFDKSRMELNNPNQITGSIWDVTQGLLARDLIWGRISTGDEDDDFIPHSAGPSSENVAGDPGVNNGPTYATMAMVLDEDARDEGTPITERLNLDGSITETEANGVTAAHRVTLDWLDHTVASVFWDFMNSSGLIWDGEDYTQDQLFENPFYATGYPITEAYWTTVRVGGTEKDVLVQCFERRCLTYTPDNPAGWQVESGNVGQHYYRWLQTHEGAPFDVIASGLNQPRGIDIGPDGTIFVAEAGTGGDTCVTFGEGDESVEVCAGFTGRVSAISNGEVSVFADGLPSVSVGGEGSGPQDVFVTDDGTVYVIIGLGGPPDARAAFGAAGEHLGWVLRLDDEGNWDPVVDIAAYEGTNNPDDGEIDSNPYSLVVTDEGMVVSDAGANALLWVDNEGTISTLAVFDARMVPAPPFLELPDGTEIPMESVPTGVAQGPDGAFYVGELTGFPFTPGMARVWRVTGEGEATVYAQNFTNVVDVSFDADGNLLVVEFAAGGLLNVDEADPASSVGSLIRVHEDGTREELAAGSLILPIGVVGADDGTVYVVHMAVIPNMGQVVGLTA
jgi:hypothetical protein